MTPITKTQRHLDLKLHGEPPAADSRIPLNLWLHDGREAGGREGRRAAARAPAVAGRPRPDQATDIFADEMEGLLTLAAQNVTVDVRLADGTGQAVVYHDYPRAETPSGLRLELGDVYAREPRPLLLEFLLATPGEPGAVPVAELVVTAHVLTEGGGLERRTITLPITVDPAEGPRVDPDVRRERLLQEAARARRNALDAQRRGDYEEGGRTLREVAEKLSSDDVATDEAIAEEAEDLRLMAERFEADRVEAADEKYLYQRSTNLSRGRASLSESISRSKPRRRRPEGEPEP